MADPNEPTNPPPSPEAKALRAIDQNLDVLGVVVGQLAAASAELAQLGVDDAQTLRRIESKIDQVLKAIGPVVDRVSDLEGWRGVHERKHAEQ